MVSGSPSEKERDKIVKQLKRKVEKLKAAQTKQEPENTEPDNQTAADTSQQDNQTAADTETATTNTDDPFAELKQQYGESEFMQSINNDSLKQAMYLFIQKLK